MANYKAGKQAKYRAHAKAEIRKVLLAERCDGRPSERATWYTFAELATEFESCRLASALVGQLQGEELLPGDLARVVQARLTGFVIDRDFSEVFLPHAEFGCTLADLRTGKVIPLINGIPTRFR